MNKQTKTVPHLKVPRVADKKLKGGNVMKDAICILDHGGNRHLTYDAGSGYYQCDGCGKFYSAQWVLEHEVGDTKRPVSRRIAHRLLKKRAAAIAIEALAQVPEYRMLAKRLAKMIAKADSPPREVNLTEFPEGSASDLEPTENDVHEDKFDALTVDNVTNVDKGAVPSGGSANGPNKRGMTSVTPEMLRRAMRMIAQEEIAKDKAQEDDDEATNAVPEKKDNDKPKQAAEEEPKEEEGEGIAPAEGSGGDDDEENKQAKLKAAKRLAQLRVAAGVAQDISTETANILHGWPMARIAEHLKMFAKTPQRRLVPRAASKSSTSVPVVSTMGGDRGGEDEDPAFSSIFAY